MVPRRLHKPFELGAAPSPGGARDAKNRQFWSLAVKTDGFSRFRKWGTGVFVDYSRMGFPIAQIIVRFGRDAAKNRQL